MRTPVRSVPPTVERAAARARRWRWLDAAVAWLLVWAGLALVLDGATATATALVALLLLGLAALVPTLRGRWRPLSALAALSASRDLVPGDHAWLVLSERVEPVIVTARRRWRLVVASPGQGAEGLTVRRTRVFVVPST
jgi:hypothetical protein